MRSRFRLLFPQLLIGPIGWVRGTAYLTQGGNWVANGIVSPNHVSKKLTENDVFLLVSTIIDPIQLDCNST